MTSHSEILPSFQLSPQTRVFMSLVWPLLVQKSELKYYQNLFSDLNYLFPSSCTVTTFRVIWEKSYCIFFSAFHPSVVYLIVFILSFYLWLQFSVCTFLSSYFLSLFLSFPSFILVFHSVLFVCAMLIYPFFFSWICILLRFPSDFFPTYLLLFRFFLSCWLKKHVLRKVLSSLLLSFL